MSTTLERPPRPPAQEGGADPRPSGGHRPREGALLVALAALLAAAALPLGQVFVGWDILQPVLGAAAVAVGITWGCQRLGAGSLLTLLGAALGWVAFASVAFFPDTLVSGVLPTPTTLDAAVATWERAVELIRIRPVPVFPEPELVFITVAGVWVIAYLCAELVFRLQAPAGAIGVAMLLWGVPLTIGPRDLPPWPMAVPLLAGAALLLLASAGGDLLRWGSVRDPDEPTAPRTSRLEGAGGLLVPTGWIVAAVAIAAGVGLAGALPGFGERPLYDIRGASGGGSVTTNPIVSVRANLVAPGQGPVMRVSTPRPVYLRTTSLDVYGENEEWTNDGIRGAPVVGGGLPPEVPVAQAELVDVSVTVDDLSGAALVPSPYQPVEVSGPASGEFRYDRDRSTLVLGSGAELSPGDEYTVSAAIPSPGSDALAALSHDDLLAASDARLTALPDDVPDSVVALARDVVEQAGAQGPFEQALALQAELRSWEYSLVPPPGHGRRAIQSFIENRVGYCEQYAATMAVMLRTLDVPARVAVGYTPGQRIEGDDDGDTDAEYAVTRANAHAWVEVLFADYGWIAFEPTPRDDGNVLVPSATNLAPAGTVGDDEEPAGTATGPDASIPVAPGPTGDDPTSAGGDPADGGAGSPSEGGVGDGSRLPLALVLATLATAVVLGGGAMAAGRGRTGTQRASGGRVLDARDRVERVGRGLGVRPRPWETDREYLERLAGAGDDDADTLAAVVAQARWASGDIPSAAADAAEEAAGRLNGRLLESKGATARRLAVARGTLDAAWVAAAAAVGRRVGMLTPQSPERGARERRAPGRRGRSG